MRAYRSVRRFRGDASFSTWMYRITANCAATLLATPDRARHQTLDAIGPADDRDLAPGLDLVDDRDRVATALAALSPSLRAVVVLRDIYDLPHPAIAEELGVFAHGGQGPAPPGAPPAPRDLPGGRAGVAPASPVEVARAI